MPDKISAHRDGRAAHRQKGFLSSRQGLVLLLLLFLAPTFVAWVMHRSGESGWKPSGTTNHGVLVHPARPLQLPAEPVPGGQPLNAYLQGKWTLVYAADTGCDKVCVTGLYNMRQVHILQNEHSRRVQRLFLVEGDAVPAALAELMETEYPNMSVVRFDTARAQQVAAEFVIDEVPVFKAARIYIVDPLGNLMMYYPPGANPGGLHKDLKKLLKSSKIG